MTTTNSPDVTVTPDPVCPACGMIHPPDAVFCPYCGKAVGGLRYVREEFALSRKNYEAFADAVTRFVSAPSYFGIHTLWFVVWFALNSGAVMLVHRFDTPPEYNVLTLLLSIEAVFLTGFLLVSQNREAEYERKRAELDYETAVHTSRLLHEMSEQLKNISARTEQIERDLRKDI